MWFKLSVLNQILWKVLQPIHINIARGRKK